MSATSLPAIVRPRIRAAARNWRPELSVETLALLGSVYFAATANGRFWAAAWAAGDHAAYLMVALFVLLVGLHGLLLGLLLARRWARALLGVLFLGTALATYYMGAYGVYLDGDMLRNVAHTDWAESRELLTPGLLAHLLLFGVLPCVAVQRVTLKVRPFLRALAVRSVFLVAMWSLVMVGAAMSFKDLSSLLRNHHDVRYLVTPSNYLYGVARMALAGTDDAHAPLLPIAEDARRSVAGATTRPRLVVLVVGETVRAANWGLDGYRRDTTPELAASDAINFSHVRACGTSTEVSLPCMFSPFGREDYDERRIRTHQSFLHVLDRLGVAVEWHDNQSGCKGVCRGLPLEMISPSSDAALCNGLRCYDEVLLGALPRAATPDRRDRIVVLHMLGNHGPSYFQRYPPAFERFRPACRHAELGQCSQEEIVNAYDNAVLYTDHVLAGLIGRLSALEDYDTAMIYLSDHGESLGERGMYLHGVPYAIAPRQQVEVPMVMWFSPRFAADTGLDVACLRARTAQPTGHDSLYPTVLGLFDVQTASRRHERDLVDACRGRVHE